MNIEIYIIQSLQGIKKKIKCSISNEMSSDSEVDRSSSSDHRRKDDDIDSDKRSRSRSKHRNSQKNRYSTKKTIIKIPELSGHLIKFKIFLNNQPQKIDSEKANKAYNKYKKDWEDKQNQTFLIQHKNDAWFIQKYYPQYRQEIEQQRQAFVRSLADIFYQNFKQGSYEGLNLSITDPSVLGNTFQYQQQEQSGLNSNQIILGPNVDITKKPFYGFDSDYLTLFIKSVPRQIFKKDILQQVKKIPGFRNLFLSQPLKKQGFTRYCWIIFNDEDSFAKAEMALSGLHIKGETLNVTKSHSKQKRIRVVKVYPRNRIETDCRVTSDLIRTLNKQNGIQHQIILQGLQGSQKQLDLNLLYLRRVHGYDYFTAQQFLDERQLSTKIGLAHLRTTIDFQQDYDISNVFKKVQQQAQLRTQSKKPVIQAHAIYKEEIQNIILNGETVKQKQVWKCTQCQKKFVSNDFLTKHMIGKHPQVKKRLNEKISIKAYCEDKNKIKNYIISSYDYDDNRKNNYSRSYRGGPNKKNYGRRDYRQKEAYQDYDDPKTGRQNVASSRKMVNFLDI